MRRTDDLDELMGRDRRDEIRDLQEFAEEDLAFLEELRDMEQDFN